MQLLRPHFGFVPRLPTRSVHVSLGTRLAPTYLPIRVQGRYNVATCRLTVIPYIYTHARKWSRFEERRRRLVRRREQQCREAEDDAQREQRRQADRQIESAAGDWCLPESLSRGLEAKGDYRPLASSILLIVAHIILLRLRYASTCILSW